LFNRSINRAGSSQDSASEEAAILGETGMSVLQRLLRMESHKSSMTPAWTRLVRVRAPVVDARGNRISDVKSSAAIRINSRQFSTNEGRNMAHRKLKTALIFGITWMTSAPVWAQSSVTLYGIVDDAIAYQSSSTKLGTTSGGKSNVQLYSGAWSGSRFGFRGTEDLGGGLKAVFQLENGFNVDTGTLGQGGLEFGRRAFVGFDSAQYGLLTLGRQYTPYFTLLAPYSPIEWLGMHPGDVDAFDFTVRGNNSIAYISPKLYGFTFGGMYALAGIPGTVNRGSTWSGALQYAAGPVGVAAGFLRVNNSTVGGGAFGADSTATSGGQTLVSSLTNGYQTAQAQNRFALVGTYRFNRSWDVNLSYSNVQYIPGVGSNYRDTAIFNTEGVVLHWKASVAFDIAAGYSYTRATEANGITDAASYHQFHLTQLYALSKRTTLYGFEAYQRANGNTLGTNGTSIIRATPTIGDFFQSSPSSSASQVALIFGITHRF
jgi:predicted porin